MDKIKIVVTATNAVCVGSPVPLTTGMVGLRAEFTFSSEWDNLTKTAVCVGSGTTKDVLDVKDEIIVPHECLKDTAGHLKIGVYGVNSSGDLVIPTVYAYCGRLLQGADPSGEESADPTLPIWAQLQAMMGDLGNLTTTAKENLVAAINEAAKSGGTAADVRMQVAGGYIQYSSDGGANWNNLIAVAELIGAPGKTAYDYAVEAGYTGTEAEFSARMAAEIPTVDGTLTQSGQAADAKATGYAIRSLSEEIANVGKPTEWKGKRLSVLGTSISAYPNTIPEGYECYYTAETMPSVDDMWWKKLCDSLGMELLINNSYSGSCVAKRSGVTIPSGSETVRNMALDDGEHAPDVIIVEMGTNDFLVSVSVGSYSVSSGETFDIYSLKGAYAKMLWNILCRYPNSKVYCTTIMPLYQGTDGNPFPTSKSAGGIEAYNDVIEAVANIFGVEIIDLNKCGITAANLVNYTVDGRIHPNADGQTLMANMTEKALSKFTPVLAAYIDNTVEGDSTDSGGSGGDSGETGEGTLLHSFDFTTGQTTDSVGGLELTASNVTFDSNGALFSQGKSQLELADAFDVKGKTLVLEFGDMDGSGLATTTFHNTWRVFTMGHNTFRASGLSWNTDTNKWNMTQASTANTLYEFDGTVNELANGTLKIVIDSSGNGKIYFNDVLKRECPSLVGGSVYIDIGKTDGTFYSMVVKKFEIYSNG